MTEDQQTLLLIRGTIAGMTEEQQRQVSEYAARLRQIANAKNAVGLVAYALVGAELQLEAQ